MQLMQLGLEQKKEKEKNCHLLQGGRGASWEVNQDNKMKDAKLLCRTAEMVAYSYELPL